MTSTEELAPQNCYWTFVASGPVSLASHKLKTRAITLSRRRARKSLQRGRCPCRALVETFGATQPLDVDRDYPVGTMREDARELHIPSNLVPHVRRARRDARRER